MTALYKPVLIESAAQAEALPVRTPIIIGPFVAMRPDNESFWGMSYSDADYTSRELVKSFPDYDLTALVPIEAEEEKRSVARHSGGGQTNYSTEAADNPGRMGEYIASLPVESRLVTPWEAA